MDNNKYKYIYGPVPSWRLGSSLGVDLLSDKNKICTFDCVYCQLGKTKIFQNKRRLFIPTKNILAELAALPPIKIDYITISGRGEPTLADNLGEIIENIKKIRKEKVAVITNSSLLDRQDVQRDLMLADFVLAKLDAHSREMLEEINRPMKGIVFHRIIMALKEFRDKYKGKLALQIMFIAKNIKYAETLAQIANNISPDEIQINTPLRPCAEAPLNKKELSRIKQIFLKECKKSIHVFTVYEVEKNQVRSISDKDTLKRRGKS